MSSCVPMISFADIIGTEVVGNIAKGPGNIMFGPYIGQGTNTHLKSMGVVIEGQG